MRRTLIACLLASHLGGCRPDQPPASANEHRECADFEWMLGTWQTQDDTTQNVERWMPDDDGLLRGESITRSEGQVVYTESLRIARGPTGAEYRAAPQDQPPNVFALETCGQTWARFTDPAYDWPQSIHDGSAIHNSQTGLRTHPDWSADWSAPTPELGTADTAAKRRSPGGSGGGRSLILGVFAGKPGRRAASRLSRGGGFVMPLRVVIALRPIVR